MLVVGIAVKMAKRSCPFEEFEDVSKVSCTSPNTKIHGVVDSLSPMRSSKSSSCSYFDGEITDEKATMRFFGFDAWVRRRLVEFSFSPRRARFTSQFVKVTAFLLSSNSMSLRRTPASKPKKRIVAFPSMISPSRPVVFFHLRLGVLCSGGPLFALSRSSAITPAFLLFSHR